MNLINCIDEIINVVESALIKFEKDDNLFELDIVVKSFYQRAKALHTLIEAEGDISAMLHFGKLMQVGRSLVPRVKRIQELRKSNE